MYMYVNIATYIHVASDSPNFNKQLKNALLNVNMFFHSSTPQASQRDISVVVVGQRWCGMVARLRIPAECPQLRHHSGAAVDHGIIVWWKTLHVLFLERQIMLYCMYVFQLIFTHCRLTTATIQCWMVTRLRIPGKCPQLRQHSGRSRHHCLVKTAAYTQFGFCMLHTVYVVFHTD